VYYCIDISDIFQTFTLGLIMTKRVGLICSFALFLSVLGCTSATERTSIEGTVTYEGKPLDGGTIFFMPEKGPGAGADIGPDGKFTVPKTAGTMPGNCKIRVEKFVEVSTIGSDKRTSTKKEYVIPRIFSEQPKSMTLERGHNKLEINLDDWK
jgi:hypothetical protein